MSNETRPDLDVIREYAKRRASIGAVNGVYINDSVIELFDRIDRLTESNRRLANQIVGYGDRGQESVRSIQADAWDEGSESVTLETNAYGGWIEHVDNPYRTELTTNH